MIWILLLALLVGLVVVIVQGGFRPLIGMLGYYQLEYGKIGVVYRRYGKSHPEDRFTVRIHKSPGPQAATLEADRIYWRSQLFYRVETAERTNVPAGTIGVVVARAGGPPALASALCDHVECNYFQDGERFLRNGGQMGRQPGILPGGASYSINPELFEVLTVDNIGTGRHGLTSEDLREIAVPEGTTGVVIALVGAPPDDEDGAVGRLVPGHESFQLPWVFLANGGQQGAQSETLMRGGVYRINPWFARHVLIPTRDLTLEWTDRVSDDKERLDASFSRIRINVEGHWLHCDMAQTIRIPAKSAGRLVGRFGEQGTDAFGSTHQQYVPVRRFVERVLGRTVEGYFQAVASEQDNVREFLSGHNKVRLELEDQVSQALAEWEVEAVRTTVSKFEPEDKAFDDQRRAIAQEREHRRMLEEQTANADYTDNMARRRIDLERERSKAAVAELEETIRVLGRDHVAMERLANELSDMNVPQMVGGNADALLSYMPLSVAQDLIGRVLQRPDGGGSALPPIPAAGELEDADDPEDVDDADIVAEVPEAPDVPEVPETVD